MKVNDNNGPLVAEHYTIQEENWYKALPYCFRLNFRTGDPIDMYLPISPSNLTITTNFATNMISTLYGTVEEHSAVRYYDIVIEGTTGMAPKYVRPINSITKFGSTTSIERESFAVDSSIFDKIRGYGLSKTLATLEKAVNKISDVFSALQPNNQTGLYKDNTGYVAFHNLYRNLLAHKADTALGFEEREGAKSPLEFINYKDNNQYSVVIKNFTLKRSADNPMLYYYAIVMRGYNLKTADSAKEGLSVGDESLKKFGLNGVSGSSFLGDIKQKANQAKAALGALGAGINIFGR